VSQDAHERALVGVELLSLRGPPSCAAAGVGTGSNINRLFSARGVVASETESDSSIYPCLKNWTARSCFSAASRLLNVPRFRLMPVFGLTFREYNRYLPDFSFRIIWMSTGQALRSSPVRRIWWMQTAISHRSDGTRLATEFEYAEC
jgi:hypothetical protein